MLASVILLCYFAYNILLFMTSNLNCLLVYLLLMMGLIFINCLHCSSFKINSNFLQSLFRLINFIFKNFFFVVFVVVCNILFISLGTAIIIGARLFLALLATYLLLSSFNVSFLMQGLCNLLLPLRFFRVDTESLSLIIMIALSFIPILFHEARITKQALRAKGYNSSWYILIVRPQTFIVAYVEVIFNRIETVVLSLRSKGYE